MKITFKNVGAIEQTELDLRPMTVIIGPNNSNKTYLAYLIYGFLNVFNRSEHLANCENKLIKLFSNENNQKFSLLIENKEIAEIIKDSINLSLRSYSWNFHHDLSQYFQDTTTKIFSESKIGCNVSVKEVLTTLKNIDDFNSEGSGASGNFDYKVDILFDSSNKRVSLSYDKPIPYQSLVESSGGIFLRSIIWKIFSATVKEPILLPAERSSFILTYKMLANRRYRILRERSRKFWIEEPNNRQYDLYREQGDIRYPEPIEDFLDFLTDIELQKEPINKSEERMPFLKLADDIEKHIQSQNKTQLKATKMGGKELKVNVKKDLNIDLYNASSSIKQLAPLLLYLRYRAKKNDLLIIDEPEMNLHPESQVKLLEALAILTNLGVNVLLTTHSPYFMSHLNNLVAGNKDNPKVVKKQAKSLYMQNENAFLRHEDVSAYEMKDNKLVSLKDDEYGIRWDTLSDVSVDVQQKYFEIFESGENSHNGK